LLGHKQQEKKDALPKSLGNIYLYKTNKFVVRRLVQGKNRH
jgi:hypothetical protein